MVNLAGAHLCSVRVGLKAASVYHVELAVAAEIRGGLESQLTARDLRGEEFPFLKFLSGIAHNG